VCKYWLISSCSTNNIIFNVVVIVRNFFLADVTSTKVIYNRDVIKIIREKGSMQSVTSVATKKVILNFLVN
jgi:hypothetical protein